MIAGRRKRRAAVGGCVAACMLAALGANGQETRSVLMKALADELERTMAHLRLGNAEPPYFVAYRVVDSAVASAWASMGATIQTDHRANRWLAVDMRVGSPTLDNTGFVSRGWWSRGARGLPIGDDYLQLRRAIWLATDGAYKNALDQLARKRAALQNKTQAEQVADFSAAAPFRGVARQPALALDARRVRDLAEQVSRAVQGKPRIHLSAVEVRATQSTVSYVNSEGSSFVRDEPLVSVHVVARTQAEGGSELVDFVHADARAWNQLPSRRELLLEVERMLDRLARRRLAVALTRYAGPVLFEGQAAAELVAQVLAPRLVGFRVPVSDSDSFGRFLADEFRNPFLDKIGARVLARSLSVVDDPAAKAETEPPFLGSYVVDDDGVPAQPTPLIQNGILKTLLTSRAPAPGLPKSTGNRRGDAAAPSNLLIVPRGGLSDDALRAELLSLVSEREGEFGVVVRRMASPRMLAKVPGSYGGDDDSRSLTLAYKVFPDGAEELIVDAVLPDFDERHFRDVVAVSATTHRYHTAVRSPAAVIARLLRDESDKLTTIDTPSLLFEDVTVRHPPGSIPQPPVLPHPLEVRP